MYTEEVRSVSPRMVIISGGQTGVDRAALDFALSHRIPCGGYCPAGRLAEDGRISDRYPLQETETPDYAGRTEMNVRHSDGTLILYSGSMAGGTQFTYLYARSAGKPIFSCDLDQPLAVRRFQAWLRKNCIRRLNVAGPRESQHPGIYQQAFDLLPVLFTVGD